MTKDTSEFRFDNSDPGGLDSLIEKTSKQWNDALNIVPSPTAVDVEMTPAQWKESYASYLAQSETLTVTEILFDADTIDPDNLEWALAETKRVFGNRVIIEVFRSGTQ